MQRIDVEERRARLVRRHRIGPADRAADPLTVARSLVCLHATDAVTVYLSIGARSDGVSPADVERALYEERSLVRMLAMRRTLWAVPRELVPVVFAAATRAVAATQRKRLEGFVRDSGVSTRPGAWITRAGNAAVAAVAARGEAMTTRGDRGRAAAGEEAPLRLRQVGGRAERRRARAAADGDGGPPRPRPAARDLDQPAVPLGHDRELARRADRGARRRRGPGRAAAPLARGLRAGHRDATCAGGPAGRCGRRAPRSPRSRTPRSTSTARPATCSTATSSRRRRPSRPRRCCRRSTRRRWAGRSATGTSASTPATLFDSNGNAGPTVWWDGRVVGGWSQRRDGEIVLGLLEDVGRDARAAIEAEAARLAAWVGDVRFSPGFLPPFQRALASTWLQPRRGAAAGFTMDAAD